MNSCPRSESLRELVRRPESIDEQAYSAIETHLEECPTCREVFESLLNDSETAQWRERLAQRLLPTLLVPHVQREDGQEDLHFPFSPPAQEGTIGGLGEFQICRKLGAGAMGTVFEADDVRLGRKVALKILHPELAGSSGFRKQFEREAQSAAAVDHEHVMAIYQVCPGTKEFSLPYLVIEYIEGETLAQRLEREKFLQPHEAAEIARQVALGLAAAHSKGKIHRDIKPSNVMLDANTGRVRITDFGLARAIETMEVLSSPGVPVGTPAYMSPEQIQRCEGISARSDLFSLGIMLYEMLTGERPFRGTSRDAIWQQIVHEEPRVPSKVNNAVSRDLETITLKCLAKEPDRRYQAAPNLADDLQRFLEGKPISARPVGAGEIAWLWCKRHKVITALTGAIAASLIGGVGVSSHFAVTANRLRLEEKSAKEAVGRERDFARRNLSFARAQVDRFLEHMRAIPREDHRVADLIGLHKTRSELEEIAKEYEKAAKDQINVDAGFVADYAKALCQLARITHEIHQPPDAIRLYEKAIAVMEASVELKTQDRKQNLATAYNGLAAAHHDAGRLSEAEKAYKLELPLRESLAENEPKNTDHQAYVAQTYDNLGLVYAQKGEKELAKGMLLKALSVRENLLRESPGDEKVDRTIQLALSCDHLGQFLRSIPNLAEAGAFFRKAITLLEDLLKDNSDDLSGFEDYQRTLAMVYNNRSVISLALGKLEETEVCCKKAQAILERLASEHPAVSRYQVSLAMCYRNYTALFVKADRHIEAEASCKKALAILEKVRGKHGELFLVAVELGTTCGLMAASLAGKGKYEAARAWSDRGIRGIERFSDNLKEQPQPRHVLGSLYGSRGSALAELGNYSASRKDLDKAVDLDNESNCLIWRFFRSVSLAGEGDYARSLLELEETMSGIQNLGSQLIDYTYAKVYSLASAATLTDSRVPESDRSMLSEMHATKAIRLLVRLRAHGYFTEAARKKRLLESPHFKPLAAREAFQRLVTE